MLIPDKNSFAQALSNQRACDIHDYGYSRLSVIEESIVNRAEIEAENTLVKPEEEKPKYLFSEDTDDLFF